MLLQHKNIAIIGGGPVGLTLANLLQQKGVSVKVYERDADAQTRIWGGTLDLHKGTGQDALATAGLLQKYYALAKPMGRLIADEQGRVLFAKDPDPETRYDNPEINRNDLRTILLDSLQTDTVVWSSKFISTQAHNGRWLLQLEGYPDAYADVVIAANGGMSKARELVTDARIEYTGSFIVQAEVTGEDARQLPIYNLCGGKILMAAHKGNLLTINPDNNGALTYGIIFKTPAELEGANKIDLRDKPKAVTSLLTRFNNWGNIYKDLFRATSFFAGFPTRKIPMERPWKTNRPLPVTLVGDAAHIMPPFAGQGVNTGLKDAHILADNLTGGKFTTIDAAIEDYEHQMFAYAREAQQETAINEIAMQQPDFSFSRFYR